MRLISVLLLLLLDAGITSWAHPLPELKTKEVVALTKFQSSSTFLCETGLCSTNIEQDGDNVFVIVTRFGAADIFYEFQKSVWKLLSRDSYANADHSAEMTVLPRGVGSVVGKLGESATSKGAEAAIGDDIKTWQKVIIGIGCLVGFALLSWAIKAAFKKCCCHSGRRGGSESKESLIAPVGTVAQ